MRPRWQLEPRAVQRSSQDPKFIYTKTIIHVQPATSVSLMSSSSAPSTGEPAAKRVWTKSRAEISQDLLKQVSEFDRMATKSLVNDYVFLDSKLKERNPFHSVTHFVAAALLAPPFNNLTEVQVLLVERIYEVIQVKKQK